MTITDKTILLLGGSAQQVVAIDKANELGYRTVLCDYLPDNPGKCHADSFHLVSTTDREAVLRVAIEEKVDGVVAYASDPAAPTAAYVSECLGLPGIPYKTAQVFCEKQLFRQFLKEHNFNVPDAVPVFFSQSINLSDYAKMKLPLIVKPTDSSGSKGVTVIRNLSYLNEALVEAMQYSRNGIGIVEEFIERDHPHVIEAEIFVVQGTVSSWGLINSIRDDSSNPLLPAGYTLPIDLSEKRLNIVKSEIARLIKESGIVDGAINIEMIIDKQNDLYFLDAGPRNGGNMLPDFISMASGKDIIAATLHTAMGETNYVDVAFDGISGGCWGLEVLHSSKAGVFQGVAYSDIAKTYLVREEVQLTKGELVKPFERCNDLVGLSFFKFPTTEDRDAVMLTPDGCAKVLLKSS